MSKIIPRLMYMEGSFHEHFWQVTSTVESTTRPWGVRVVHKQYQRLLRRS